MCSYSMNPKTNKHKTKPFWPTIEVRVQWHLIFRSWVYAWILEAPTQFSYLESSCCFIIMNIKVGLLWKLPEDINKLSFTTWSFQWWRKLPEGINKLGFITWTFSEKVIRPSCKHNLGCNIIDVMFACIAIHLDEARFKMKR